jgi:hypothetical protein
VEVRKTGVQRQVRLHPDLVAHGFMEYVDRVKATGAKRLFPAWKPTRGRASIQAEKWFRELLAATGLRDETPGARAVGMHAFRHTLLTMAANSNPAVDARPITCHVNATKSGAQRGYEGELSLANKMKRLQTISSGSARSTSPAGSSSPLAASGRDPVLPPASGQLPQVSRVDGLGQHPILALTVVHRMHNQTQR